MTKMQSFISAVRKIGGSPTVVNPTRTSNNGRHSSKQISIDQSEIRLPNGNQIVDDDDDDDDDVEEEGEESNVGELVDDDEEEDDGMKVVDDEDDDDEEEEDQLDGDESFERKTSPKKVAVNGKKYGKGSNKRRREEGDDEQDEEAEVENEVKDDTASEDDVEAQAEEESTEDGDEDDEDDDEVKAVAYPPEPETVSRLQKDKHSKSFKSLQLPLRSDQVMVLKKGQAIELRSDSFEPWLGKITAIRALNSDLSDHKDENGEVVKRKSGAPIQECITSYVQVEWLYSKKMFETEVPDKTRFRDTIKYLGKLERVETDSKDWYSQEMIETSSESLPSSVSIYRFDDRFPVSEWHSPLCPFLPGRKDESEHSSPLVFFGDDGPYSDRKSYVRTRFEFEPSTEMFESSENGKGKKKARNSSNKKRKIVGPPLTFSLHSISRTPYDPKQMQVFSKDAKGGTWYNLSELKSGRHLSTVTDRIKTTRRTIGWIVQGDDEEGTDELGQVDHKDDSDEDGLVEVKSHGKANGKTTNRENGSSLPSKQPVRGSNPTVEKDVAAMKWLLDRSIMVRGGAYGLIGNTALLAYMQSLSDEFDNLKGEEENLEGWQGDVEETFTMYVNWLEGVKMRKEKKTYGWIAPPEGKCFVCPVSGDELL